MQNLIIRFTILIVCCLISGTRVAAVTIGDNTVWPAGTYTINDNITILNGATLTIEEGATVRFATDGYLWVQVGALDATGVTFTSADGLNEWRGISISGSDSRSRLVNCTIEHAKGYSDTAPAMVYLYGAVVDPGLLIEECIIGNGTADQGIYVAGGASPQIMGNTFNGFSDAAVHLESTRTATVSGNTFNNNAVGVHINYGSSYIAPTVTGNTYFFSTDADVSVAGNIYNDVAWNEGLGTVYRVAPGPGGLNIEENGRLTITDGIIVKVNPGKVIWLHTGVLEATGVTFTAADENNEWDGIWLTGDSRSRLENCVIERVKGRSSDGYSMVRVQGGVAGHYPSIINCIIGNGRAQRGIYVAGASPQILGNTISGFSDYGIYITGSSAPLLAGNTITGNRIGIDLSTTKYGLYRVNRIENNSEYGVSNGTSSIYPIADARFNWWGSPTGPTFVGNPMGTGDEITSKVEYLPFFGSIADTESDGMWDEWEIQNFTNTLTATEISDFDEDGLLDSGEFLRGTDPKNKDSDGDGVLDGLEVQCFLNPLLAGDFMLDSDYDGYSDLRELIAGTDQWNSADIPEILADHDPQPSGDGDVDGKDLLTFIAEMGLVSCSTCQFDLDNDGDVDNADLFLFTEDFGRIGS
jgi:parallel beta-helix repeat protein